MSIKSRLQKLTNKLNSKNIKIYYMGWANCTWSESEGIIRKVDESKDSFCKRVYKITKKQYLWFD
jgi:imidazoleglycerol phosphate synthase glutamine amidotransferase subunit HisH